MLLIFVNELIHLSFDVLEPISEELVHGVDLLHVNCLCSTSQGDASRNELIQIYLSGSIRVKQLEQHDCITALDFERAQECLCGFILEMVFELLKGTSAVTRIIPASKQSLQSVDKLAFLLQLQLDYILFVRSCSFKGALTEDA